MKLLLFTANRDYSPEVIAFVRLLARCTEASITLQYVAARRAGRQQGEDTLARAAEQLAGLKIARRLQIGNAIRKLHGEIKRDGYDMVVIGARAGLDFFRRKLASLSKSVVSRRISIPVMVVRETRQQLKRFLICTSGWEQAKKVIERGADLARLVGAKVTLMHVGDAPPGMYTGLSGMEESLEALLDSDTPLARHLQEGAGVLDRLGVEGELYLCRGVVDECILREAVRGDFDLVVLGASGASESFFGWVSGDVTQQIIERSDSPVLVVN